MMWRVGSVLVSMMTGIVVCVIGLLLADMTGMPVAAAQSDESMQTAAQPATGDEACLVCHTENTPQQMMLADGSQRSVAVNHDALLASVHGLTMEDGPLGCTDCHGEDIFPHNDPPAASIRAFHVTQSNICIDCHEESAHDLSDDLHNIALQSGNLRAATCVDCHGAHDVQGPDRSGVDIAQSCGDCHQIVYNEFADSVHGQSLLAGDPNVPTCIDCHGVHGIQHPTTALFRNRSPELCADCHADEQLMSEYDITTNVFNSYLSDFHGTTVALFEQQSPDVATNKAVCYDCHGVHDIARTDAGNSHVIRENLLATCQQCHPNATADFPDSWVGHFPPTLESHPLLFLVDSFYTLFIPVVLGGFVVLVLTDIYRRIRRRSGSESHEA